MTKLPAIPKPQTFPILPGIGTDGQPVTLGVMGGGQLGRMFVHAAQAMGYATAVLDPDATSPAGLVSHLHVRTDYLDGKGLGALAHGCAAITTEFENVPAQALQTLADTVPVAPAAHAVRIAQDRAQEKAHFGRCGVPCAPYAVIETETQLEAADAYLLPGVLKTSRMGYDGKGQIRVKNRAELAAAWGQLKNVPCVLEKMLALKSECSVIVARGWDGECVNLPVQLNLHREGILAVTEVSRGNLPSALTKHAVAAAKSIAHELRYVGVLCVEFFILKDGSADRKALGGLVVNEIAPRPHNSGHYSMNACDISQFELQVRTLAGLPLPQPRQHSPAIMINLLGDLWFPKAVVTLDAVTTVPSLLPPAPVTPPWERVLMLPGTHLHLYGKAKPARGRKMGHLNITGNTVAEVRATALRAAKLLGIKPFYKKVGR